LHGGVPAIDAQQLGHVSGLGMFLEEDVQHLLVAVPVRLCRNRGDARGYKDTKTQVSQVTDVSRRRRDQKDRVQTAFQYDLPSRGEEWLQDAHRVYRRYS
jgi:hypothetical protein